MRFFPVALAALLMLCAAAPAFAQAPDPNAPIIDIGALALLVQNQMATVIGTIAPVALRIFIPILGVVLLVKLINVIRNNS